VAPTEIDALVADLMAKHVIALVDRERLMAAIGRSDDRAAEMALEAISGRTINTATGIVMHQRALSPEGAEDLLRRAGAATGSSLYEVATYVVRSGALADSPPDPAPARKRDPDRATT
jgi:ANTAR domain